MLADSVAFRPGPRETITNEILATLREATLAGHEIEMDYHPRGAEKLNSGMHIGPVAILFGQGRQYLLACNRVHGEPRLYALSCITAKRKSTRSYVRPEDFNLQDWLNECFGLWREPPLEVEWRFLPHVAQEAEGYLFHAKQTGTWRKDGSYVVRFRAGGRKEMGWYLARWRDGVRAKYRPIAQDTTVFDVLSAQSGEA